MSYKKRSLHWILAILVIVVAPIIVLITPFIISTFVFNDPGKIVFISYGKSLIMYGLAFFIAFIALAFIYFLKRFIVNLFIGLFAILLFFNIYHTGAQYYVYFHENYIEYNPLFGETVKYEWNNIARVYHELPTDIYEEKYIFEFNNGDVFEFVPSSAINPEIRKNIYNKIMSLNVSYEEY